MNTVTGRFLSEDPFWGIHNMQLSPSNRMQSGNLFAFVKNNPVMWVDPTGLSASSIFHQGERREVFCPVQERHVWTTTVDGFGQVGSTSGNSSWGNIPGVGMTRVDETSSSSVTSVYVPGNGWHIDVDIFVGLGGFYRPNVLGMIRFNGTPVSNVRTFSRSTDSNVVFNINGFVTPFTVGQFASRCGADEILIDDLLIYYLNRFNNHFDGAITITSGFRTPAHDRRVGGSGSGFHTLGMAADIQIAGTNAQQVQAFARELGFGTTFGGLGLGSTFTHIDVRTRPTVWTY